MESHKHNSTRIIRRFNDELARFYKKNKRDMPWRDDTRPYYIVMSEIMLQQTQVHRVLPKFKSWIERFPDWRSLAEASTKEVIAAWSGLGYNRRALYVKQIAEAIVSQGENILRESNTDKASAANTKLPGIGPNTAASIRAFAFNIPSPFIETNIRSVFIHHFFPDIEKTEGKKACKKVGDKEIMPFIEQALADAMKRGGQGGLFKNNAREWYWALMDYGSFLKKRLPNPSRRSAHHAKQSKFEGSNRELRSKILQTLMKQSISGETLVERFKEWPGEQVEKNLSALAKEGFLFLRGKKYRISL